MRDHPSPGPHWMTVLLCIIFFGLMGLTFYHGKLEKNSTIPSKVNQTNR